MRKNISFEHMISTCKFDLFIFILFLGKKQIVSMILLHKTSNTPTFSRKKKLSLSLRPELRIRHPRCFNVSPGQTRGSWINYQREEIIRNRRAGTAEFRSPEPDPIADIAVEHRRPSSQSAISHLINSFTG